MAIGNFGRIRVFEDFLAPDTALTWSASPQRLGQVGQVSVNEGSFAHTVDEPGGILACTTDNADDDNVALYAGPFKPADGGCVMEARFKRPDVSETAVFCGFSETLAADTPVCPAEATGATPTLTINGSGGMAGMLDDQDCTTKDWRAVAGDGGAVASKLTTATGTRANAASVDDEWDVVRVEIDVNGDAKIYHDGKLIDDVKACVTPGDVQHAVLLAESRTTGGADVLEVDYFFAEGGRDWAV